MKIEARSSAIEGSGIFAVQPIAPGETVHMMGGERVTIMECVKRVLLRRIRIDDPLQISADAYLVLDPFSVLFNHSCDPNALLSGENRMIARRAIAVGDEVTFDYAATVLPTFYLWFWGLSCRCGAATCRGRISDVRSIPDRQLQDYARLGGLQDYMCADLVRRGRLLSGSQRHASSSAANVP